MATGPRERTYYGSETPPPPSPWFRYPPGESPTALASVALALAFGFVLPLVGGFLDAVALVTGVVAVVRIRHGRAEGMRRAVAAIAIASVVVLGYAFLLSTGRLA